MNQFVNVDRNQRSHSKGNLKKDCTESDLLHMVVFVILKMEMYSFWKIHVVEDDLEI